MKNSLVGKARHKYHRELIERRVFGLRNGVPTLADVGSTTSKQIASALADIVAKAAEVDLLLSELSGQTLGKQFTDVTRDFLQECFEYMNNVRPGPWYYETEEGIAQFEQYRHLSEIARQAEQSLELRALLGADYIVKPDIVISRERLPDEAFGEGILNPNDNLAQATPLRAKNAGDGLSTRILHASVSCKWTMRSDRAQNTRTEALNLIRNRKGKVPMIVAVTAEPMPTRLASLALGTGDIDRVYHFALYELREAVSKSGKDDQREMLDELVQGNRLADISDLPFDLAI